MRGPAKYSLGWGLNFGLLVGLVLSGCLVELPSVCGDGIVDGPREECDPAVSGSEECDPVTCTLRSTAVCGNNKLETGEECDTNDFGNKACPSGEGYLICTADCRLNESMCDPCGNGRVDPGEECDPRSDSILAERVSCASLTSYPIKPYSAGEVTTCTSNCLWYRGPCNYCGDQKLDPERIVDLSTPEVKSPLEICDGATATTEEIHSFCRTGRCSTIGPDLECSPRCLDDCSGFDPDIPLEDLRCCLGKGSDCPDENAPAPCCSAYKAQDEAEAPIPLFDQTSFCELIWTPEHTQRQVCK